MVQDQLTTVKQNLSQIADMLLLNGTLTESSGLVHGKMGIAIFFFHYAQYTGNMLFADYAMDLIGKIQSQIHTKSPADYEKGIAGIGVGINYLIWNEFLDAENDIFEDFDQRMYRAVMYDPWLNFSLYDGLTGYGRYWILRLCQQPVSVQAQECLMHISGLIKKKLMDIPIGEQTDVYYFLHDLYKVAAGDVSIWLLEQFRKQSKDMMWNHFRLKDSTIVSIIRMYQNNYYYNNPLQDEIEMAIMRIPNLDMRKSPVSMGLLTGYAGEGLLRLAVHDSTNRSWMRLL